MKYKVGDKVIIRSWEDMARQFGVDSCGDIMVKHLFTIGMRQYCGTTMTIERISGERFYMKGSRYIFGTDMFESGCPKKIVITSDGAETLARLYEGNKVVKSATAKCSPEDAFDFNIGAKLAFERLMTEAKRKEKKLIFFNGKAVCAKSFHGFTVGKIYDFVDGKTRDDHDSERPVGYRADSSFKNWKENSCGLVEFIPLVEETKGE